MKAVSESQFPTPDKYANIIILASQNPQPTLGYEGLLWQLLWDWQAATHAQSDFSTIKLLAYHGASLTMNIATPHKIIHDCEFVIAFALNSDLDHEFALHFQFVIIFLNVGQGRLEEDDG